MIWEIDSPKRPPKDVIYIQTSLYHDQVVKILEINIEEMAETLEWHANSRQIFYQLTEKVSTDRIFGDIYLNQITAG